MTGARQPVHATVAAIRCHGAWHGVLIQGRSGAGKSDLALRLVHEGWRLVTDDRALVFACRGALYAAPPATIAGRMEVRGLGIVEQAFRPVARLALSVHLTHSPIERMPAPDHDILEGVALPRLCVDPHHASSTCLVRTAIQHGLQRA